MEFLKQQLRLDMQQKSGNNCSYPILLKLFAIAYVLHLSGCASIEIPMEELPDDREVQLNADQQHVIENQQQRIQALEQQLAEKDVEIKQKRIREKEQEQVIEAATHEIVRTQIKLHRLATRSSSASLIAEAEVAMEVLKQQAGSASDVQLQVQTQQLLDVAGLYFSQEDYAAATHYASQSIEFTNMIAATNRELPNRPTVAFNLPIRLQTIANANLRQAPKMQAAVRTVLKEGVYLTATAYQGNWLRVQTENNLQGWVSNTLIKVSAAHGEF